MSYNLIINSDFKTNTNWKFNNCYYKDNSIISTNKVFGIEQELILTKKTKLYLRTLYKSLSQNIYDVMIGIQNGDILTIDRKIPKYNHQQSISVVDNATSEKIKIQIIFQSLEKDNIVEIKEPILVDLKELKRSTWLKLILDRSIKYLSGYTYTNIYPESEIKPNLLDFKDLNLLPAKTGSIFKSTETKKIAINAKFIDKNYYLVKLDLNEINKLGNIYFQYGVIKSIKTDNQIFITFRATKDITLYLVIEPTDVLDYRINLKHLLITNITKMNLQREDIMTLPYIGE